MLPWRVIESEITDLTAMDQISAPDLIAVGEGRGTVLSLK